MIVPIEYVTVAQLAPLPYFAAPFGITMARTKIDTSVERKEVNGFQFPLGVYPIESLEPKPGYTVDFEPADGGESAGDWEEWPDRYMFDIVAPANRIRSLCRAFFALLPSRVYPILDMLGEDAFREVDPYIAYDPAPLDRFLDLVHRHKDWLFEDGLVGFGAMSEDPFLYVYIDEHKIVTVRAEARLRERIEKVLDAFDISPIETLLGADAAAHEHRSVLSTNSESLLEEEILEELIEQWRLQLNVDRESNVDDAGRDLGVTCWRCLLRAQPSPMSAPIYAQVWLRASNMDEAETLAFDALASSAGVDFEVEGATGLMVLADRITPEVFTQSITDINGAAIADDIEAIGVFAIRIVEADQSSDGS